MQHSSEGLKIYQSGKVRSLQRMKSWPTDEENEKQHSKVSFGLNSSLLSQTPMEISINN